MTEAITIDDREVTRLLRSLNAADNKKVLSRSTSKAVKSTRTEATAQTTRVMETRTKAVVRKSISMKITGRIAGVVSITSNPISGSSFRNKLTGPKPRVGSRPIGTKWWADSQLKTRKSYFRMFKSKGMKSPIVKRKGKARLPVDLLFGPTAFDAMNAGGKGKRRVTAVTEKGSDVYQKEVSRQIDLVLKKP